MKIPRIIKQRNTYVDRIRPFMRKTLVKVMVGHRRVGKSFILYQLMELIRKEESDANIIYINKEDVNFIDIKTYKELNDYILSIKYKHCHLIMHTLWPVPLQTLPQEPDLKP